MRWMRRRGDRVRIISGAYEGHRGTVEANVYQNTGEFPDEWANGYHVKLDSEVLVTVRWDQKIVVRPAKVSLRQSVGVQR
jgi:ribosomal protein L24